MSKRYPNRDPKPGSVAEELARRSVVNMLRRVKWRVNNPDKAKFPIR